MPAAALPAPALSAAGFVRPGRYATECRLMFVLIGPGHSTDAVTGLLRPWRSRASVAANRRASEHDGNDDTEAHLQFRRGRIHEDHRAEHEAHQPTSGEQAVAGHLHLEREEQQQGPRRHHEDQPDVVLELLPGHGLFQARVANGGIRLARAVMRR